jgi:hypothetical protein
MYQATPGGALRPGTEPAGQGETQGTQRDLAKMEHQAKIKDYDTKIQQALDSATPEGKELADRLSYAKQSYLAHSPWGSEGNHPGVLGKIAHGLARTGEIAADIAMPGLTQAIPGTPERMARQQAATQGTLGQDVAANTARMAEEAKESKPSAQDTFKEATQGGITDPAHPELGPQQAYVDEHDPTKIHYLGPMPAKEGTAANTPAADADLADYKQRVANSGLTGKALEVYGNAPTGATKAELDKRFDEATKLRGMNQADAEHALADQARTDAAAEHKTEHTETAAHTATEQTGKVYDNYSKQVDKVKDPVDAIGARAGLAIKNLDLKDKAADALVAPEILTLAAGGQGSGLRMNEAEIQRIVGGRDVWDTLKSKINYLRTKGGTFDDVQRAQLKQIATYIADRSSAISSVLDVTRENMLAGQSDESAVRKSYNDGKKVVSNIEEKGIVPPGGTHSPGDYIMFNGQVMIIDEKGKGHPAL